MKKKGLIIVLAVVAVVVILIGAIIGSYNELVEKKEEVLAAQSQISNQLQRRADLIPNFVETVKGYSDYEQETFTAVTTLLQKQILLLNRQMPQLSLTGQFRFGLTLLPRHTPNLKQMSNI